MKRDIQWHESIDEIYKLAKERNTELSNQVIDLAISTLCAKLMNEEPRTLFKRCGQLDLKWIIFVLILQIKAILNCVFQDVTIPIEIVLT